MTAKRFTETLSTGIVTDNVTGKEYNCEMRIDDKLLELLNELHEENESLKEENKFLRNKIATYKTGNALLKKRLEEKTE